MDPTAEHTQKISSPRLARQPIIRIVDVHKSFGGQEVLKGVHLDVPEGSTVVILGGSGSGKTVLMRHMIGLFKPDSGQVIVDGEDIAGYEGEQLDRVRQKFGMVFQGAALFDSMTVYENVSFQLREHEKMSENEMRRIVEEKLAVVGLRGIENKLPAELSGGMRKRVGLARAIARNPKIVLYDEPTTGLDPITTEYVDDMIMEAKEKLNVTSVVISHDVASAFKVADKLAMLYEGRIVAEGPPAEFRKNPHPHVQHFLGTWFGKN